MLKKKNLIEQFLSKNYNFEKKNTIVQEAKFVLKKNANRREIIEFKGCVYFFREKATKCSKIIQKNTQATKFLWTQINFFHWTEEVFDLTFQTESTGGWSLCFLKRFVLLLLLL